MTPTLLLVDGNALFYRAYHAFPKDLTTPDGQPSGATFGFTRILMAAVRNLKPTHLAVCFDTKGATFRDELLKQYKATRAPMPEDLVSQVPMIWELVDRMEAPRYSAVGLEADDLIGTIARQVETGHPDMKVIILSSDRDMLQLVTDRVHVYSPQVGFSKAILYTPAVVKERFGFAPIQMIDYKALRGDTSDNIPGVPGIGEVSGKQLIADFGTLDKLYEAIKAGATDGLKPSILKKLQENEDLARVSYTVATIKTDADIKFDEQECRLEIKQPEKLVELFQKYNFKSLIKELPQSHRLVTEAADIFAETAAVTASGTNESAKLDEALAPILREMESFGVKVDRSYLKSLEEEFDAEITKLRNQLHTLAGQPFNTDSPQQIAHVFYKVLGIPTEFIRKGKHGYTTDAATMHMLAPDYPIAALLLAYREVTKLQSTYVKPLQELADSHDRIHTSYAPDTATGRISSRNPNLQNIPIKTEQGRRIRQAFIAPKGKQLVAADYSQIELRVAAHLSQDPVMMEAFASGKDFHAETGARMGVDRRVAKIINFSILYGKGAFGFSQDLGISMAEAKEYIEQYFKTYAGLKKYLDTVLEEAKATGRVATMLGRVRELPDIQGANYQRRSAAEREAVNLPIQGTAAEILKKAMVDLVPLLKNHDGSVMILTVHDELVLEVPDADVPTVAKLLKTTMENAVPLSVPVVAQVKSGPNWNALHELL